jgi:[ribosomal protein S5]-alanine N-acetyltransferase
MPAPLVPLTLAAGPWLLRPFEPDDGPAIQEAGADPLIPLITTVPSYCSLQGAADFIARQQQRWITGAGYSFAIARPGQTAVGQIGLWLRDAAQGRASIGYWVIASERRQGVATHALRAISSWGLTVPDLERLELYVEPWNEGSWRVAEQAGYQREGLLRSWQQVGGERRDMYVYALLRSAQNGQV